jgi:putative chitinase
MLTEDILRQLWPRGDSKVPGLIAGIAAAAPTVFPKYGLTDDLTIAHAMAQFSHECGAGTEMVENTHYSAERAAQVWPLQQGDKHPERHFADAADCYR